MTQPRRASHHLSASSSATQAQLEASSHITLSFLPLESQTFEVATGLWSGAKGTSVAIAARSLVLLLDVLGDGLELDVGRTLWT